MSAAAWASPAEGFEVVVVDGDVVVVVVDDGDVAVDLDAEKRRMTVKPRVSQVVWVVNPVVVVEDPRNLVVAAGVVAVAAVWTTAVVAG